MNTLDLLNKIKQFNNLSITETEYLFFQIMNGELSDDLIEGILIALAKKGESSDEITGGALVLRDKSLKVHLKEDAIDTCGTGGDGKHTLNISTACALVLASMGLKVAKHGNKSLTSKCGSADVLEKLGISIMQKPDEVKKSIEEKNFGFMFAPNYHSAMKNVANVRKKIKIRTIFNLLGPLANPALVKRQCIGVFSNEILDKYSDVLKNLNITKAWIFHSEDGLDEISIFSKTNIIEINGQNKKNFSINPSEFLSKIYKFEEIIGQDAAYNAKKIIELFEGSENAFLEIVSLNCAAALIVAEKNSSLKEAFEYSRKYILSGVVLKKISELKQ
jgi:anthranilate phosphoribosyltransferase